VRELTAEGWVLEDIADELGVSFRVTSKWRHKFLEFEEAIKEGRVLNLRRLEVERAAAVRALIECVTPQGSGEDSEAPDGPAEPAPAVAPSSNRGGNEIPHGLRVPAASPFSPGSREDAPDWRYPSDGEPVPLIDPFDNDW
jgi:hypothetical protein